MHKDYGLLFKDKVVLITGGTGYLGKALTREILKFSPRMIKVLSRDEAKHHMMQELFKYDPRIKHFVGDIRDFTSVDKIMPGVDIVIHAAALKRIDMIEYNVSEAITIDILGTQNVAAACMKHNVETAVMISTDKACAPVNTYGACKLIGERVFIESNYYRDGGRTKFVCVRYGNVLESTGSVIPLFEEKIRQGQKLPLTDPRMTRFIISPQQATELIFNAIKYGKGGEVFVPILPAFNMRDLITVLLDKHKASNEVQVIGTRPGEKIHEIMINSSEIPRVFKFRDMYVITSHIQETSNDAEYAEAKHKVSEEEMTEYSSKDAVIPPEEVKRLFKQFGLM